MKHWLSDTCKANNINIHYLRTGGDKPPVVLLHGLMLSGACWTPFARMLENDYDVIMPDARGHGHSSVPEHGYDYATLATDVLQFIDALQLDQPVLLGHSMGGMTAAMVASMQPERLRKVILADPTFLSPKQQQEVYESNVKAMHSQVLKIPKHDFLAESKVRQSHRPEEVIELFTEARYQTSLSAFEILTPPNPDYTKLINKLTMPSLLVIGDNGSVVTADMANELAKQNQQLQVTQIEGAGHAVPYDQPERFVEVVKGFLQ